MNTKDVIIIGAMIGFVAYIAVQIAIGFTYFIKFFVSLTI
jgi:hypothetical protein